LNQFYSYQHYSKWRHWYERNSV